MGVVTKFHPRGFIIEQLLHIEQNAQISNTIAQNHVRGNFSKRGSRGVHLGRANAPAVLRAPDAPNYVFHENRLPNMRKMQTGCEIDGNLANDVET